MKQKCQVEIKFKRQMSKLDALPWVSVKWYTGNVKETLPVVLFPSGRVATHFVIISI